MKVCIFRPTQPREICVSDLLGAQYKKGAFREWAPKTVDCLTSIWYIFKRAKIDVPLTYIGDMPRALLSSNRFKALQIDIENARCGDVLFVKGRRNQKRLITHVALFLSNNQIFHCSSRSEKVQSRSEFFKDYEQGLNFIEMVRYIDLRNSDLRNQHGGIYVEA